MAMSTSLQIWIDVENAGGTVLGPGPITTAYSWQSHPRLDAAGEFGFEMPASDARGTLLTNKRIVRCYSAANGTVTEMGAGIIDTVETTVSAGAATPVLTVSGTDLLTELSYRTVGDLVVREQAWTYLDGGHGSVRALRPGPDAEAEMTDMFDANLATSDSIWLNNNNYPNIWYLYVGYDARFDRARFTFQQVNTEPTTILVQYFDGEDWQTLSVTDGTSNGTATWAQDGVISWTRPADWVRCTPTEAAGSWFWVRFTVQVGEETSESPKTNIYEIEVYADEPTTDGVNLIMAYAPDTWTQSGYPTTVTAKYAEFHGESVLEALTLLAEQGGQSGGTAIREHFRLIHSSDAGYPAGGRAIEWLGTSAPSSGIRAVRVIDPVAFEDNDDACAILNLSERKDTLDAISRILPYSADGVTLADTTREAPSGYTLSTADNYIKRDQAETDLGRIEAVVRFTEIAMQQSDSLTVHPEYGANALFDRALEYLRTHSAVNYWYDLDTTKVVGAVLPGQTLDIIYHDYVDGEHVIDIDTVADGNPVTILATIITIDPSGVYTVGFETGTIDRQLTDDNTLLVDTIQDVRRMRATQGNYGATVAGLGTDGGPLPGADIRVDGREVSRAGNRVLLFHGDGAPVAEYLGDTDGMAAALTAALAAATDGDVLQLPAGTIPGDHTIPAGVEVVGRGRENTVLSGQITLGDGSVLRDLREERTADQAGDLIGVVAPASGMAYVIGCDLVVNNATGDGFAVQIAGGDIMCRWSLLSAQSAGVDSNPIA